MRKRTAAALTALLLNLLILGAGKYEEAENKRSAAELKETHTASAYKSGIGGGAGGIFNLGMSRRPGTLSASMESRKDDKRSEPDADQIAAKTHAADRPEILSSRHADGRSADYSRRSSGIFSGTFIITAYTADYESTQKRPGDPGYGITRSGEPVTEGVTLSADIRVLPLGTVVYIEGVGRRIVQDTGSAIQGNILDLYVQDLDAALKWGRQERKVWVIEWGKNP